MAGKSRYAAKSYGRGRKKRLEWLGVGNFVMFLIVIVSAISLVISYFSAFINPSVFSVPLFFGLYYIPILIINIVLFIIGLFKLRRYMLISMIALLPSLFIVDMFLKTSKQERNLQGVPVKIVTYNVGRFAASKQDNAMQQILDFVEQENPDILCLQEFRIKGDLDLESILQQLPYRHYHFFGGNARFGNIIFSRYKIINQGELTFKGSTNLCVWADIEKDGQKMRVYNCHLESHGISFTSLIKKISRSGDVSNEVKEVHEKILGTNIRRSEQVNSLVNNISSSPYPAIICGDFNDPPMSYTYHKLKQGCKDSFVEGGKGFSATYSVLWPLLRIDYILIPDKYEADDTITPRIPFSDHYPVTTKMYINE
ncbi:MAG: endonuclease/exonuclease/phosphatase family protein [Bacteroidales bacterium]|nr:endonuclease/exonuclease/phosphatase family protein [Bacteroidales bacterium]